MKVVWSPLALQKLGDAAEFIALDNPSAAEKWVNDVFDKTELIDTQCQKWAAWLLKCLIRTTVK